MARGKGRERERAEARAAGQAAQRTPVQCYIKRVRKGFQKLWPYYVLS